MKRIFRFKKRTYALAGVVAVAAITAVGGYAYWTTSGSGNGTATAGTDAANLVLHGSTSGLMYPGGPGRTVSFTVDNPSNFNQSVSNVHLVSVQACSVAWDYTVPASPTCNGGAPFAGDLVCGGANSASNDFQMADVGVNPATNGNIAPNAVGQSLTAASQGTLYMNNLASNQNACKNAFLNLSLTSS